jgi:hypothetical protein
VGDACMIFRAEIVYRQFHYGFLPFESFFHLNVSQVLTVFVSYCLCCCDNIDVEKFLSSKGCFHLVATACAD